MINRRTVLGLAAATAVVTLSGFAFSQSSSAADYGSAFDQAAFDVARAGGGPVLVDISASWCSTCKAQARVVEQLVSQPPYADYQIFVVDYDTQKDIMRSFGANQRSTLIAFRGETEVGRIVGDTRADSIEALLASGV